MTYLVLDASGDVKATADRTFATGRLVCDGRVHREGLDLSRTEAVQLTVNSGLDTSTRGWLIITNR